MISGFNQIKPSDWKWKWSHRYNSYIYCCWFHNDDWALARENMLIFHAYEGTEGAYTNDRLPIYTVSDKKKHGIWSKFQLM